MKVMYVCTAHHVSGRRLYAQELDMCSFTAPALESESLYCRVDMVDESARDLCVST